MNLVVFENILFLVGLLGLLVYSIIQDIREYV